MTNIVIVGEAYGEAEDREKTPFIGASGWELTRILEEAGIARADCFLTNVFNLRPRGNDIKDFCGPKSQSLHGYPSLGQSRYIRAEFEPELARLGDELLEHNPNVIVCCGNTPLWALSGRSGISKLRGTPIISTHCVAGFKLLPTYHPAAILRQWELRPIAVIDFMKALRESAYPEIRRPAREIWIEPNLDDIRRFIDEHIRGCRILSTDIETAGDGITCIGFAPNSRLALNIPFHDTRKPGGNYWETKELEREAWNLVREVLEDRRIQKSFQNGLYDIAFLWRSMKIRTYGTEHDTMLLHHALQPESLKGLGFLGSIYTDETSWKTERKKTRTIKRDE